MNKLDMASISISSFQFSFSFKCNSVIGSGLQLQLVFRLQRRGDKLQVDRVGFVCKMVSVDGSIQNRLRILEKN